MKPSLLNILHFKHTRRTRMLSYVNLKIAIAGEFSFTASTHLYLQYTEPCSTNMLLLSERTYIVFYYHKEQVINSSSSIAKTVVQISTIMHIHDDKRPPNIILHAGIYKTTEKNQNIVYNKISTEDNCEKFLFVIWSG